MLIFDTWNCYNGYRTVLKELICVLTGSSFLYQNHNQGQETVRNQLCAFIKKGIKTPIILFVLFVVWQQAEW